MRLFRRLLLVALVFGVGFGLSETRVGTYAGVAVNGVLTTTGGGGGGGVVDSEFPAAATITDNFANPSTTSVFALLGCWDATGTNWDRCSLAVDVVEDVTSTSGITGPAIMGIRLDTLASSANANNENAQFILNAVGALYIQPTAGTNGGADGLKYTSVGSTEDEHAVKASPGTLYSITVTNSNAAFRYIRCENDTAANTTPGSETPELDLGIPPTGGFALTLPVGYSFSTALTCWLVTGAADTDVAEVAANEIKVFYSFK